MIRTNNSLKYVMVAALGLTALAPRVMADGHGNADLTAPQKKHLNDRLWVQPRDREVRRLVQKVTFYQAICKHRSHRYGPWYGTRHRNLADAYREARSHEMGNRGHDVSLRDSVEQVYYTPAPKPKHPWDPKPVPIRPPYPIRLGHDNTDLVIGRAVR
jgi:hypothetical protein